MMDDIALAVTELMDEAAAAGALSRLTEEAGAKAGRARIDALLPDRARITALLTEGAPKARKNAARLLGALRHQEDAQALAAALSSETTLFVIPSILLALGNIGGDAARLAAQSYAVPTPTDETETKHCREIAIARDKALDKLAAPNALPAYALAAPREVLLVAPEGFASLLCEELRELGYAPTPDARGARVTTDNLQKLFRARLMAKLLLPIAESVPTTPDAIAAVAANELTLPWRVELVGYPGERRACIAALVALLPPGNAPSHYALELTIECHGNTCDVFLCPTSLPDGRFIYRKEAIPASIAPATAAALARLAVDTWKKTAGNAAPNVLDPFCGSATLLIELSKYANCASLLGVDIKRFALDAAKGNCAAARANVQLIQKDCTRFVPRAPFDIIVSNMPFGNRVGTHAENERLYRDFARRLPAWLMENGVCVLYTAEYRLLAKCLQAAPGLTLLSLLRTEAGGLNPWVFVLQKRA